MGLILRYRALFVLLFVCLAASDTLAQDGRLAPIPEPVFVTGRVVDDAGKPVWGVEVTAATVAMGRTLFFAHTHGQGYTGSAYRAATDRDGRYTLIVPYAGIQYSLGLSDRDGYRMQRTFVVPTQGGAEVDLVATPVKPLKRISVLVSLPNGNPATHQLVTIVGGHGGEWSQRTDGDGLAVFDDVRVYNYGRGMFFTDGDWLIAPLTTAMPDGHGPTRVTLVKPAGMTGRVVARDTGEPIEAATVIVTPRQTSGLEWQVKTDADGRYRLSKLPPGQYVYRAVCATHADRVPGSDRGIERTIKLDPGLVSEASEFNMQPRATIRGRVVGPDGKPVEHAMVGLPSHHHDAREVSNIDTVFTDADGRFELRPMVGQRIDSELEAFHPLAGGARLKLEPIESAELRDGIELKLSGTAAVRGQVTDPQGNPIAGIACQYNGLLLMTDVTDAQGRYDLGRVQLATKADQAAAGLSPIYFTPKRPESSLGELPKQDEPSLFYVGAVRRPVVPPDGEIKLEVKLHQTSPLTFTGNLKDDTGQPILDARVYLLPDQVVETTQAQQALIKDFIEHTDAKMLRLFEPVEPRGIRLRDVQAGAETRPENQLKHLVVTGSTESGFWGVSCLRTDTNGEAIRMLKALDWSGEVLEANQPLDTLKWATVLAVWGKGEDIQYKLYKPTKIADDQSHYTYPAQE